MKATQLLSQRRFLPFFLVQFSFAFNDNVFKNAMVLLLAFKASSEAQSGLLASLAAGLLIVPFFIFSPLAGQIADKYDKAKLIQFIKFAEILIMSIGAVGFIQESSILLFGALFLLGTHSAFFGPAKFAILPQSFDEAELLSANALVELGTFAAILLGTILGGYLSKQDSTILISVLLGLSLLGYVFSLFIPKTAANDPTLKINYNPITEFADLYRVSRSPKAIFLAIMGISWFWFLGSAIMIKLPAFTQYALHAEKDVVTLLLASFCLSIGVGSIVCELLSGDDIEIGLVPLGAFGISFFLFDLSLSTFETPNVALTIKDLFAYNGFTYLRVIIDIFGMGFSGAFFIIPLNAYLQDRSDPKVCARVIAANNIFNAIFMIAASAIITFLYYLDLNSMQIFGVLGVLNIIASIYIFSVIPEFTMRFILWVIASTTYRVRYSGKHNIPRHGPAIIVSNHVSFIDWFIIAAAIRRPVRFVMWYKFFQAPLLTYIFKLGKAIPIASAKEDPEIKKHAFARIQKELADDNVIVIFPEGTLTPDGHVLPFRPGVEEIQKSFPTAPIIPMVLKGLWGSYFSRSGGKSPIKKVPKPKWRVIQVLIGEPIKEFETTARLEATIKSMLAEPAAVKD